MGDSSKALCEAYSMIGKDKKQQKDKELLLMNGRWEGRAHVYVAAYSVADAYRMLAEVSGYNRGWRHEINVYFSKGLWGNSMDGIELERGVWVQGNYNEKPKRVL